ncbi:beta-ketoacyl-ACP synthase III [Bacteroides sp. 224]|uniref:beta-ketoacyl-ACP synthase III n=1 Tax=Bacteroides sp. 224 TaxID=2302936 RepID=UPI0013D242BF|nr:beta-ketoacyl-ACP synthase III [Bacteroides sp. 224]NDV64667.1 StlD/DarB family beta-ketosynthase [Bacteroides sp. 224]
MTLSKKLNDVYINRVNSFLPNEAVTNDRMEDFLGLIQGKPSRVKNVVLRQNGIKSRYYALDTQHRITHTNADMAATAIRGLFDSEEELKNIELLTVGTASPDQIFPSQASMTQGLLKNKPMEVFSTSGVCLTSLQALKIAYLSVLAGDKENAVCCASELISASLLSKHYDAEYEKCTNVAEDPYMAFEKDFLRFMLSDGAGAVYLENKPNENGLSLKLEWIDMDSYANELPTCMLAGGSFREDGEVITWKSFDSLELAEQSVLAVKQDIRLLKKHIIKYWVDHIEKCMEKHGTKDTDVTYVIPHVSSMFFYQKLLEGLQERNLDLLENKWFTNLTSVGNVASASIYIALDELIRTKPLKKGDTILLLVPESGRFSYGTVFLSVN